MKPIELSHKVVLSTPDSECDLAEKRLHAARWMSHKNLLRYDGEQHHQALAKLYNEYGDACLKLPA